MTQTMDPPSQTQANTKEPAQPAYEITDGDRARQQTIKQAWHAYNGLLNPPLKKMPDGPDPNVMSNRCRPIVDRGIDFLFGKEIEISCEESAPEIAQETIDKIWGRKEARVPFLQKLGMNGAMAGHAFLRIVPGDDNTFRLVVVDPGTVFVKTAPQDCETVLLFCIEYSIYEKRNGKPTQVYYREEIERIDPMRDDNQLYEDLNAEGLDDDVTWSIQHWTRVGQIGLWTAAGAPIMWEYPFPPLFHCQNLPSPNDFWGIPDITPDLIGVNSALNLVQSNINLVNALYGQPIIWASGVGESSFSFQPGRVTILPPTPESKMGAVPIHSDLVNALKFAEDLRSDLDEQSSVPGVATGRITAMPRGQLSGIAIELLFMPLLKKTEKKRNLYGELIIDVSKALLALNRMNPDIDITIAWQYPLPTDDLPAVQAAIAKQSIGISDRTLQRELGYDPDEELILSQTEDAQKLEQQQQMVGGLSPAIPGAPALPGQQYPQSAPTSAPPSGQVSQGGKP